MPGLLRKPFVGYVFGILGVVAVDLLIQPFLPGVRVLTAANMLLVVVLIVAMTWGMGPALVASVLGALYLNYEFVPPIHSFDWHVNGSEDEIALIAFLITAVTVGQLSSRAQKRAIENQQLYDQLRNTFDQTTRLEVIRRSERFKSALLDSVTHDLRTPLTSIKAASTAIIDIRKSSPSASSSIPGAQESEDDLLSVIVQQSNRLNHFIEGLIEMASVEEPGTQKIAVRTPVDELIGAAIARAGDALRNHKVTVECQDDFQAPVNAKAVAQVLFSLLENAGKYSPQGTIVNVAAYCDPSGNLRIAVEDRGPGVPVAMRGKVFDKFFRGDSAEVGEIQVSGLGLGLAIARNIVEVHGGQIWVEDRQSGEPGARFVFTLPLDVHMESNIAVSEVTQ